MALFGTAVEYGLHCLLWLARPDMPPASSRDLAELQGAPAAFIAKIFPNLEKAGIVRAQQGIQGGYQLARGADAITVLEVVDAIEGRKSIFKCQEIRGRCALFKGTPPSWSEQGLCGIHAMMLRAEKRMREELHATTIADLARGVARKAPANFADEVQEWLSDRVSERNTARSIAARSRSRTNARKPSRSGKTVTRTRPRTQK
jgi:Rrf2 family protein